MLLSLFLFPEAVASIGNIPGIRPAIAADCIKRRRFKKIDFGVISKLFISEVFFCLMSIRFSV